MVSIKDIARHCGVSTATVSKALNGQKDIGEATRELVCAAAAELGYQPNSAARALKTNRTYNLGVLFVDEMRSGLTHEYFSAVLDSFKVEAEAHGYDITFITHNIGGKRESYLDHCRYRGVDGVMVASVDFADPQVLELVNGDLPVVTIDHAFHNRTAILSDNVRGMQELVRHVYDMGHRRVAFIHGERTAVTESRLTSFYRTCAELGLEVGDAYVREGVYHDPKTCARLTKELLALNPRPTCIFFPDDFSYMGAQNTIREAGLRIPEDISAVGYDGIYLSRVISPVLATYVQNTAELGRRAAAELVRMVEEPRTTLPERFVIEGALQAGKSVLQLN